jgi:NADPH:quinone reductase
MAYAVRIHETGGPEVLRWEKIDLPAYGPKDVRIRHTAVGLNYIDTYHRSGLYPLPLPAVLGSEAAGVVTDVGSEVHGLSVGDRVAYATAPVGSYTEERNVAAAHVVKLPQKLDDRTAAATMLKGLTAHYLVEMIRFAVPEGAAARDATAPTVLVHAAAGGTGLLLTQWAKAKGCTVIGTVGNEEKAKLAQAHGCDHVILYRHENVPERVRAITNGAGADVVYDSVGKDTFHESLDCVRPRGMLVSFGQSSGPIGPFDPRILAQKGSLFFTRPTLHHHVAKPGELEARATELFGALAAGTLKVRIAQTYPLRDAERAHRDLEARKTTGSSLLLP